jgi:GntR family transcriptional regulator
VAIGVLKPNDPLPAVRALADDLKINANTVQHAYRTLVAEGTVHVRRGLGTFVSAGRPREPRARQVALARQIAERMLREAYRHGLLASDLRAALDEIAPRQPETGIEAPGRSSSRSGPGGEEQV